MPLMGKHKGPAMRETMTNTVPGTPERPFDLKELGAVLMRRDNIPYGFFVSQELWDVMAARFLEEGRDPLQPIPQRFNGILTAVDPNLPAAQFDVAFTEKAWIKRLRELRRVDGEQES